MAANDEFFAPKENLLKTEKPIFVEREYSDRGKWMDGWETRRRRTPGHDWCIVRLGLPGLIRGVLVDTSHFRGNYPEHCSIEVCAVEGYPDLEALTDSSTAWVEVLAKSELQGDAQNVFAVETSKRCTHLKFKIYPDGGVARLRVYGDVMPDWNRLAGDGHIDLAAVENGGLVVACSDMFFGSRHNLIMPGRALNMRDGWETRRRRGPGYDWVVIRLGARGAIDRVEVDTSHFKGNFPESCSLEVCDLGSGDLHRAQWTEILSPTRLQAHTRHFFEKELRKAAPVTHVRFNIFPDGGVSRLRIIGCFSKTARLDSLSRAEAESELLRCCGSTMWARYMVEQRPFKDLDALYQAADRIWWTLQPADWLEAFSHHPKIGEQSGSRWSQQEQSAAHGASEQILAELLQANRAYQEKFGYIFIVCATGKTAEEMLAMLRARLQNDPETELRIAAEEQRRITRLRLEKLLSE